MYMESGELNLKFENLPPSLMYYRGGWVEVVVRWGWGFNNPPKKILKCILARDKVETVLFF